MLFKTLLIIIVLLISIGIEPIRKNKSNNNSDKKNNKRQKTFVTNNLKWSSPIEYHISVPSYTDAIDKVIKFLRQKTCLLFSRLSEPVDNRAVLDFETSHNNNKAFLGKVNDSHRQKISLNNSCYSRFGCILKYTLITLGLTPPILREDRDQYVKINLNNTSDKYKSYFNNTPKESYINISSFPYDYSSITHPYQYYYTRKGNPTIEILDKNYSYMIGQEDFPSFQDIKIINSHYCKSECSLYGTTCYNGGYPNPHNCSTCVCPRGFKSSYCKNLTLCSHHNTQDKFVSDKEGGHIMSGNQTCVFRYWTNNGSNVKIIIKTLNITTPYACSEQRGLQIKFEKDKTKTGIILCNRQNVSEQNPINITSEDDNMIVLINLGDRFDEVKYSLERVMITNNTATQPKGAILETLGEEVLNKTNRRKSPKHSGDKDQAANVTNDSKTIKLTNKKDD